MVGRASASMVIGGNIPRSLIPGLVAAIDPACPSHRAAMLVVHPHDFASVAARGDGYPMTSQHQEE